MISYKEYVICTISQQGFKNCEFKLIRMKLEMDKAIIASSEPIMCERLLFLINNGLKRGKKFVV